MGDQCHGDEAASCVLPLLHRGESKVREAKCEKFRDKKNINEQDEKYLNLLQHNALQHILIREIFKRRLSLVELD